MNKSDKQIFEMLEKEMKSSVENANIPLRLQKESIVAMLNNAEKTEKDFSDKTGTVTKPQGGSVVMIRKLLTTAAMLVLVVAGALVMRTGDGVRVVKTDSFYEGYKSAAPVRKAESYEEVEKAIKEILGIKEETKPAEQTTVKTDNTDNKNNENKHTSEKIKESLIEGYSEYVAIANQVVNSIQNELRNDKVANEPGGVVTNGDFKADIIKNDGEYLYIVSTGINAETGLTVEQVKILRSKQDGGLEEVSELILSQGISNVKFDECIEIYVKNKRLTAIMERHEQTFVENELRDNISTVAVTYDISDPSAPKKVRDHLQGGEYVSSNLYENRLCIVTSRSLTPEEKSSSTGHLPSLVINGKQQKLDAEDFSFAVNDPEAAFLFVTATDISDFSKEVGRLVVLGCGKDIYCSPSTLVIKRDFVYVGEAEEDDQQENLTEIFRFNIGSSKITLAGSYIAQGSMTGGVSVDENSGYLRVITTDSKASYAYVLDENMNFVSGLEGIFPAEKISTVKFFGNNCYVMVDGETEKTMIIDFSDPSSPEVAGTIDKKVLLDEVYAISETHLLGMSEDKNGLITLTLIDVSDPANPVTAATYTLDESYRSVSSDDSRSVMLVAEKEIFGIPALKSDVENGTEISGYVIFDLSGGEIAPLGTFTHDLSYIGDAAVRGTLIGNILYTVSGEKVVATDITSETKNQTEFSLN